MIRPPNFTSCMAVELDAAVAREQFAQVPLIPLTADSAPGSIAIKVVILDPDRHGSSIDLLHHTKAPLAEFVVMGWFDNSDAETRHRYHSA